MIANLKTLTTAGFSALILGRTYSWTKWRALTLLVAGVVLFVLPTLKATMDNTTDKDDNLISNGGALGMSGIVLGIAAEIVVVTLSGFASIYFEKAIKNDPFDIWERNFQLGVYSILMYTTLIFSESSGNDGNKPFSNWTPLAFSLSFLGATGGLLVGKKYYEGRTEKCQNDAEFESFFLLAFSSFISSLCHLKSPFHQVW